jgi:hypothetical protein
VVVSLDAERISREIAPLYAPLAERLRADSTGTETQSCG